MSTTYVRVPGAANFSASGWDFAWTMTALILATSTPPVFEVPLLIALAAAYPAMLWWVSRPGPRNGVTLACWMMFSQLRGANKQDVTFRALLVRRIPSLLTLLGFCWGGVGFALQEGTTVEERGDYAALAAFVPAFLLVCAGLVAAIIFAILFRSKRLSERPQWLRDAAAIRVYGHADLWSPDSWPAPGNPFKRRR